MTPQRPGISVCKLLTSPHWMFPSASPRGRGSSSLVQSGLARRFQSPELCLPHVISALLVVSSYTVPQSKRPSKVSRRPSRCNIHRPYSLLCSVGSSLLWHIHLANVDTFGLPGLVIGPATGHTGTHHGLGEPHLICLRPVDQVPHMSLISLSRNHKASE